jgi:hypothetical protein
MQSVPRCKHTVSVIKTSQLMLYREIIAVCSQIQTKHINTLCGQNVEFVNVKPGGTLQGLKNSFLSETFELPHRKFLQWYFNGNARFNDLFLH